MNRVLFLSFALLGFCLGTSAQSCWVEGHKGESVIELPALAEDTAPATTIAQLQLTNSLTTGTVGNPFNKYLTATRNSTGGYRVATTDLFPDFVTTERVTELRRTFQITCADSTTVLTTLVFPVPDLNNHAPIFNEESYNVTVRLPTNPEGDTVLVSTNIVVSDADVDFEANADVYITSSSRNFVVSVTPSTGASSYDYQVDLLVDTTTGAGTYMAMVTADDGVHMNIAVVRLTVEIEEEPTTPEPEEPTTSEEVTEDPTESPTTEEPEVTTEESEEETEEPETPEPEPTVPGPSTTTTTTTPPPTTTTTTTPAPTHTCGLTGLSPDNVWGLAEPLHPALPSGTEIWRHPLYNVVSTTAVNHAHNKYISAYRGSLTYWFTTNDFYPNFIEEQGTNFIERKVNFQCADGSTVQYHFMLEIDNTPIEEPVIPTLFKAFL